MLCAVFFLLGEDRQQTVGGRWGVWHANQTKESFGSVGGSESRRGYLAKVLVRRAAHEDR